MFLLLRFVPFSPKSSQAIIILAEVSIYLVETAPCLKGLLFLKKPQRFRNVAQLVK